tara:strand:+ start:480 stop:1040 length:561 start_codon:yes stop_codon:yes gene_type:complete
MSRSTWRFEDRNSVVVTEFNNDTYDKAAFEKLKTKEGKVKDNQLTYKEKQEHTPGKKYKLYTGWMYSNEHQGWSCKINEEILGGRPPWKKESQGEPIVFNEAEVAKTSIDRIFSKKHHVVNYGIRDEKGMLEKLETPLMLSPAQMIKYFKPDLEKHLSKDQQTLVKAVKENFRELCKPLPDELSIK